MGGGGQSGHVVHSAGAVIDVGKHQHRHLGPQRWHDARSLHQFEAAAVGLAQPLGNVQIGGEIAALADDDAPLRVRVLCNADGRRQHFEQVDRGRIRSHHLLGRSADQGRDACAQALGQVKPASRIPGTDQTLAPFLLYHLRRTGGSGNRHEA